MNPRFLVLATTMLAARIAAAQAPAQRLPGGNPTGPAIVSSYALFDGHAELTPITPPPSGLNLDPAKVIKDCRVIRVGGDSGTK